MSSCRLIDAPSQHHCFNIQRVDVDYIHPYILYLGFLFIFGGLLVCIQFYFYTWISNSKGNCLVSPPSSFVKLSLLCNNLYLLSASQFSFCLTTINVLIILQVVESGGKNIEVAVMTKKDGLRELEEAEIDEYVAEIEAEKAAAEAAKKGAPKDT